MPRPLSSRAVRRGRHSRALSDVAEGRQVGPEWYPPQDAPRSAKIVGIVRGLIKLAPPLPSSHARTSAV